VVNLKGREYFGDIGARLHDNFMADLNGKGTGCGLDSEG
jgi:hypothetical protein